jgi:hypothetical protein
MNSNRFRLKLLFLIAALTICTSFHAQNTAGNFKREAFYSAMTNGSLIEVDEQLELVKKTTIAEKEAYEGALLMRKSGLIAGPPKKLNLFKEGSKKLETAISKDSSNAEYRFLRLMVQENAPSLLGYRSNIKKDSDFVREHYKNLSETVQKAILNYNKISKSLRIVNQ